MGKKKSDEVTIEDLKNPDFDFWLKQPSLNIGDAAAFLSGVDPKLRMVCEAGKFKVPSASSDFIANIGRKILQNRLIDNSKLLKQAIKDKELPANNFDVKPVDLVLWAKKNVIKGLPQEFSNFDTSEATKLLPESVSENRFLLVQDGGGTEWRVEYNGKGQSFKPSKGLSDIAELIKQKGKHVHVSKLEKDFDVKSIENLRKNVPKRIKAARERFVTEGLGDLAEHLRLSIKTGEKCRYDPPDSVNWILNDPSDK